MRFGSKADRSSRSNVSPLLSAKERSSVTAWLKGNALAKRQASGDEPGCTTGVVYRLKILASGLEITIYHNR